MKQWKERLRRLQAGTLALAMCLSMTITGAWAANSDSQIGNWQRYTETVEDGKVIGYTAEDGATIEKNADGSSITKSVADGKVTLKKDIAPKTGENAFTVTLTVTTTEDLEQISSIVSPAAAVVLVMDVSGSMGYCATCGCTDGYDSNSTEQCVTAYHSTACSKSTGTVQHSMGLGFYTYTTGSEVQLNETRLYAAQEAAKEFITNYMADADGAARWISVVKFSASNSSKVVQDWVNLTASGRVDVDSAIEGLTAYGGTYTAEGLELAAGQLDASDVTSVASRFVILLSDGETNSDEWDVYAKANVIRGSKDADIQTSRTWNFGGFMRPGHYDYETEKGKGATLYTIAYKTNASLLNDVDHEGIASPGCAKSADEGATLDIGFTEIMNNIKKVMSAWQVTDPMGQFIVLDEESVASEDNVSVETKDGVKQLLWNLYAEEPVSDNKDPATYTYTLSYDITLDTADPDFKEKVEIDGVKTNEDQYYPTNGATELTYGVDLIDAEGHLDPSKLTSAWFHVPTVKGEIPEYDYTIQYYKWVGGADGKYEEIGSAKETGQADLRAVMTAEVEKYKPTNYHFGHSVHNNVEGNAKTMTIGTGDNVLKIYYDRDTTEVTINYFYKTDTIDADGKKTEGTYGNPTFVQSVQVKGLYVGDSYEVTPAAERTVGNKTYTYDTAAQNKTKITKLAQNGNELNLYYERTEDNRADAAVTVDHVYRTHSYKLESGKYKLTTTSTTVEEMEMQTGMKAYDSFSADTETRAEGYDKYNYVPADTTNSKGGKGADAASMKLAAGNENKITLYTVVII